MPSETYGFTGGWQRFNVPKGVDRVTITLRGGGSGSRAAGMVTGQLRVKDTQVLYVGVGRAGFAASGHNGGNPCFGGGGAGGDAHGGNGGNGGGGASVIRLGSASGTIRCVAGGAGGDSGDGGHGGVGGGLTGGFGTPGTSGTGETGNATGGSQSQGGKGGTSTTGKTYWGEDAANAVLSHGGTGAGPNQNNTHGGGGGGGGYRAGGGGQAAAIGITPGGGAGGGSNYIGALIGYDSVQGGGGTGNGQVVISWVNPNAKNLPPSPPTDVKIDSKTATDGQATKSTGRVTVSAKIDDPRPNQKVRLVVYYSTRSDFSNSAVERSDYMEQGKKKGQEVEPVRASVTLTGLDRNTRYYLRLYTQDSTGKFSQTYRTTNFWTNRKPNQPKLLVPDDGSTVGSEENTTFTWKFSDPDGGTPQNAFEFRYRLAARPGQSAGEWKTTRRTTSQESFTLDANSTRGNKLYSWTVRTQDPQGSWGPWAPPFSLYVEAPASAPYLLSPVKREAVIVSNDAVFAWEFVDPHPGATQVSADVRYRVLGTADWITVYEAATTEFSYAAPAGTFAPDYTYEWQARTTSSTTYVSEWSDSETFNTIYQPGHAIPAAPVDGTLAPSLGCGENRAFIYDRGGKVPRGQELTAQAVSITWSRVRDDKSEASVVLSGIDADMAAFLDTVHTWMHELVIFRDGVRVWEGPITLTTDEVDGFTIHAQDCFAYLYRRIMRVGYDDSYQVINGEQTGIRTVVERAGLIVTNCLSYDDPNLLPYLTIISNSGDAPEARVVPDYAKTAYEEIDDMAANAGLDYTTVGRRIIFWDTHRAIGKLPEMRNGDFSADPIVSEYGMLAANHYGVTDGSGIYGVAQRGIGDNGRPLYYGWLEMLSSSYGDEGVTVTDPTNLTQAKRDQISQNYAEQAERSIASRWPVPLIVRVPDNSQVMPHVNININNLIPGVWVPVRAQGTVRKIAQWQKLDTVTVTQDAQGEKVMITLSPAPNRGQDPDAEGVEDE